MNQAENAKVRKHEQVNLFLRIFDPKLRFGDNLIA